MLWAITYFVRGVASALQCDKKQDIDTYTYRGGISAPPNVPSVFASAKDVDLGTCHRNYCGAFSDNQHSQAIQGDIWKYVDARFIMDGRSSRPSEASGNHKLRLVTIAVGT